MYSPPFNSMRDQDDIRELVATCRSAWLVTVDTGGVPMASLLPIMWREGLVIAHMAKANPHWRGITDGGHALFIATGAQAYVSPTWYAAKADHGKVVPTWNYSAVHLTGAVRVHHDSEWLREAVTQLTETHEGGRTHPWHVTDAPDTYISGQLNGIVGIEVTVTHIEGKAKLSQNRSDADQAGVIAGLRDDPLQPHDAAQAQAVANAMDLMAARERDPASG